MSEKLNIRQKLSALQQRVSIPKNRLNKFGGYKYWNCSDILNGVKKETEDLDVSILLNDEVQVIGDRFYIKATASLVDNDTDEVKLKHRFRAVAVVTQGSTVYQVY